MDGDCEAFFTTRLYCGAGERVWGRRLCLPHGGHYEYMTRYLRANPERLEGVKRQPTTR